MLHWLVAWSIIDFIYNYIIAFLDILFAMIRLAAFLFLICVQLEPAPSAHGQAATIELIALSRDSNSRHCTIQSSALQEVQMKVANSLKSLIPQPKLECGEGLWTRVAYLNMGDPKQSCPPAWRDRSANGVRVCGLPEGSYRQCHSTFYHADSLFSRVCGQVIAYQFGSPNSFDFHPSNIDQPYVEGVSITYGPSPRSHIWTFAADVNEFGKGCPCEGGPNATSFVGTNYYCESGYNIIGVPPSVLHTSDPLWDGAGCESEGSCCSTAPWFTVDLVNSTNDDIEVRICSDNYEYEEDTPIHLLELYVQ